MIAMTIYFFLGLGLLYILYKCFMRYKGSTPVFVKVEDKNVFKNDTNIEMTHKKFGLKRAKTAHFTRFTDEVNHRRNHSRNVSKDHSRNASITSKKST